MKSETVTKTKDGITAEAVYTISSISNIAYADGQNIDTGKEIRTTVKLTLSKNGTSMRPTDENFFYPVDTSKTRNVNGKIVSVYGKGVFARFGDKYISETAYNLVADALAEAKEKCGAIEKQQLPEAKKSKGATEVCSLCHSYCFGDCEASNH